MPIIPTISKEAKNDVFPIRECVVVSAITRMHSDSRSSILGERIHSMTCPATCFQLLALRSESPAMRSPMPMASIMLSMPAKWLRLG